MLLLFNEDTFTHSLSCKAVWVTIIPSAALQLISKVAYLYHIGRCVYYINIICKYYDKRIYKYRKTQKHVIGLGYDKIGNFYASWCPHLPHKNNLWTISHSYLNKAHTQRHGNTATFEEKLLLPSLCSEIEVLYFVLWCLLTHKTMQKYIHIRCVSCKYHIRPMVVLFVMWERHVNRTYKTMLSTTNFKQRLSK